MGGSARLSQLLKLLPLLRHWDSLSRWEMARALSLMRHNDGFAAPRLRFFNFRSDDEKWLLVSGVCSALGWDGMEDNLGCLRVHHAPYIEWAAIGPVIAIQYRDECKGQCYTDPIYSLNIKQSPGIGADHKQLRAWKMGNLNLMFILNFAPLMLHFEAITLGRVLDVNNLFFNLLSGVILPGGVSSSTLICFSPFSWNIQEPSERKIIPLICL